MKWLLTLLFVTTAFGQQIDLSILDKLASKARSSVNLTFDEDKLGFISGFLSNDDPKQASAKKIAANLKAINVRVFEFDGSGAFSKADLDAIRNQVKAPGWTKVVEAKERDESAEIYMFGKGKDLGGIVIIAVERRELAVVNIVGPVDLKSLGELGGKFGIPKDILGEAGPHLIPPPPPPAKKKN